MEITLFWNDNYNVIIMYNLRGESNRLYNTFDWQKKKKKKKKKIDFIAAHEIHTFLLPK